MQLNRHYTTKEDIEKTEKDIAWYKSAIARYQQIARGDKDAKKELIQLLKDNRDQSQVFLSNALRNPSFRQYMKSTAWAAEVRTYNFVINLLDNPKAAMQPYQEQLTMLEKQLNELRKIPTRD